MEKGGGEGRWGGVKKRCRRWACDCCSSSSRQVEGGVLLRDICRRSATPRQVHLKAHMEFIQSLQSLCSSFELQVLTVATKGHNGECCVQLDITVILTTEAF